MKRLIGFLAFWLGCIGFLACVAGVIAIWVIRPGVTHASLETLDTLRSTLKVADEKTKLANQVVSTVRELLDPVNFKIKELAAKAQSSNPEDQKELKRLEEELAKRFQQVDTLAEIFQTAVNVLNKTTRLAKLLPLKEIGPDRMETSLGETQNTADSLSKLAKNLKTFREALAKIREDKQVQKEIVDTVVDTAKEVNGRLEGVQNKVNLVQQEITELDEEAAHLRSRLPRWITAGAIIGTVMLVWIGLGQLALLRGGLALRKDAD